MNIALHSPHLRTRNAQTTMMFVMTLGLFLLALGMSIDSGLLYLAKARLSRAVDGAALAAVANFHRSDDAVENRKQIAIIMRNFAVANFTDLQSIDTTAPEQPPVAYTTTNGALSYYYKFRFSDGQTDTNPDGSAGQNKRFVEVKLNTGVGGAITSATCTARCPVRLYFINLLGAYFRDLKVSSVATATRNPRLIMIVVDRSASMLQPFGGAFQLPQAIVSFMNFFDTSSDSIGIVSFGSNARLEMPLTTNFIIAGTNLLYRAWEYTNQYNAYGEKTDVAVPATDPEQSEIEYHPENYQYAGIRRFKFGGQTAADEGMRLGIETLMANTGFGNPDVVKFLVFFTDGKWNCTRTLFAAPGYENIIYGPPYDSSQMGGGAYNVILSNTPSAISPNTSPWTVSMAANNDIIPVPYLSAKTNIPNLSDLTNAMAQTDPGGVNDFEDKVNYHTNDYWQSADSLGLYEPLFNPAFKEGAPETILRDTFIRKTTIGSTVTNYYTKSLDVWLQPGSVNYVYRKNGTIEVTVSDFSDPTKRIPVQLNQGDRNRLVVPGYVTDGLAFDNLDLTYCLYSDNPDYPRFRGDNYQFPFMWPDDTADPLTFYNPDYNSTSMMRQLLFRNYPNLLTGYYIYRADDPPGDGGLTGYNQAITEYSGGVIYSRFGLGPYYPSAGFYWPFDLVGIDVDPTYSLADALIDPDTTYQGLARHSGYSINMLSTNAAPSWAGELFYKGTGGTNTVSGTGTTSVSTLMGSAADWKVDMPDWASSAFDQSSENIMISDPVHNSNLAVQVWRPDTYHGTTFSGLGSSSTQAQISSAVVNDVGNNYTGGYVRGLDADGNYQYYHNSMAWSGRPTHYFDFSRSKWVVIPTNHSPNQTFLQLGNWKTVEYAWHAREAGVKIYAVGYGSYVSPSQQVLLAQIANSTNTSAGNSQTFSGGLVQNYIDGVGTGITYNPNQPIGQQFFSTNSTGVSNNFYQVGQAINESLTQ